MDHKVVTDYTRSENTNSSVKVFVRARACQDGSVESEGMFDRSATEPGRLAIKDRGKSQYGEHAFSFDNVFWTETSQEELFETCSKSLVDEAMKGINSSCFAYGQTGSGKTYSIFGEEGDREGIIPRCIDYIFHIINDNYNNHREISLVVSFLEIYCDQVRDLGRAYLLKTNKPATFQRADSANFFLENMGNPDCYSSYSRSDVMYDYDKGNFEIHEDSKGNVFVKDLSMIPVTTSEEVHSIVQLGLKLRCTHETKMNAVSSRSHTVFTIHVLQRDNISGDCICGMLNLVDLAGSERIKKSESDGQRLKEALHINSSLSAIGKVVMSLDPESGSAYIPYRDSKLTRLLQNSIGGNSFTNVIATIHPIQEHYEECLSTLQFANRCRSVQNQPRVNYIGQSAADKDRRIKKLQDEVNLLKRQVEALRYRSNARLQSLLTKIGVNVRGFTEDGGVELENGEVVYANEELDEDLNENEQVDEFGNVCNPIDFTPGRRLGTSNPNKSKLEKTIDYLRKDRDKMRKKLEESRFDILTSQSDTKKYITELKSTISAQKKQISQLSQKISENNGSLKYILAGESDHHNAEIRNLIQNSKKLLTKQHDLFHDASECTRMVSMSNNPAEAKQDSKVWASKLQNRVREMESLKVEEIRLIKEQHHNWLTKKETELQNIIQSYNDYKTENIKDLEIMRLEFCQLYEYAANIMSSICGQRQSGVYDIMQNSSKLQYMKSQMEKDSKLDAKIQAISHRIQKLCKHITFNQTKRLRPESAPTRRKTNSYFACSKVPLAVVKQQLDEDKKSNDISLPSAIDDNKIIPNQVKAGGGEISYQQELNLLQNKLKAEVKRNKELRIAFDSQSRQLQRMAMKKIEKKKPTQ